MNTPAKNGCLPITAMESAEKRGIYTKLAKMVFKDLGFSEYSAIVQNLRPTRLILLVLLRSCCLK